MMSASMTPILESNWPKWAAGVVNQAEVRGGILAGANSESPLDREAAFRMAITTMTSFRNPSDSDEEAAFGDVEDIVLDMLRGEQDQHLLEEFAVLAADCACDQDALRETLFQCVRRIPPVSHPRVLASLWWHSAQHDVVPNPRRPNGFYTAALLAEMMGHACTPANITHWPLHPTIDWVANQLRQAWETNNWVSGSLWEAYEDRLVFRDRDHTFVASSAGVIAGFYSQNWYGGLKPFCRQQYFCRSNLVLHRALCPEDFFQANKPPAFAYLDHIKTIPTGFHKAG